MGKLIFVCCRPLSWPATVYENRLRWMVKIGGSWENRSHLSASVCVRQTSHLYFSMPRRLSLDVNWLIDHVSDCDSSTGTLMSKKLSFVVDSVSHSRHLIVFSYFCVCVCVCVLLLMMIQKKVAPYQRSLK